MWTDKTERQMDMTKLTVAFHSFANVPKKFWNHWLNMVDVQMRAKLFYLKSE
jgi:hypothetical protein